MICSSASFSVSPSVMSLISCSPAILPIAASWIRFASILLAVSCGLADTTPFSIMIPSHSLCPAQAAFPFITEKNSCLECPLATERDTRLQLQRIFVSIRDIIAIEFVSYDNFRLRPYAFTIIIRLK